MVARYADDTANNRARRGRTMAEQCIYFNNRTIRRGRFIRDPSAPQAVHPRRNKRDSKTRVLATTRSYGLIGTFVHE